MHLLCSLAPKITGKGDIFDALLTQEQTLNPTG